MPGTTQVTAPRNTIRVLCDVKGDIQNLSYFAPKDLPIGIPSQLDSPALLYMHQFKEHVLLPIILARRHCLGWEIKNMRFIN